MCVTILSLEKNLDDYDESEWYPLKAQIRVGRCVADL